MKKLLSILIFVIGNSPLVCGQEFEENELIIQLAPQASARIVAEKMIEVGSSQLEFMNNISSPFGIYHLKYSDQVNLDLIINSARKLSEIAIIQKNHKINNRVTIPNDSSFSDQWHLNNTGQTGGNTDADIDAPEAWDMTTGGNTSHGDTIVVCIIENQGVDINHIDLAGNMWKNYEEIPGNGIDDDNNGYIDDFDGWNVGNNSGSITPGSHGTRVAGMVGAIGNNITGISGVNHKVKMMVVQGQAALNESSVIAAYTYPLLMRKKYNETNGNEGAFVVATNSSWGINGGNAANSPIWCNFYDSLGVHGILNIGATNNTSSANVDAVGDLPTTCPSDYLVAVTSSNSADFRTGAYGQINVDLAAPGNGVLLTDLNNSYSTTNGTSFATPCVAGAVALLYSAPCTDFISFAKTYPDSAALKIRELLLNNVDNISSLAGDVSSGGRLNINNSLLALVNNCDSSACLTPYAVASNNITDTSAQITWQTNGNSAIKLQWGISGSSAITTNIISGGTINSYDLSVLQPCTNYEFTLQGICTADSSNVTSTFLFKTDGCCENPELMINNLTETGADLVWQPILSATEYVVRYQELGSNSWIYDSIATNSLQVSALDTCTDYDIQIKTVCADSTASFSNSYQIRTAGCGICYDGNYCEINPFAINASDEWLESFTINGITSVTGNNNGYFAGDIFGQGFVAGSAYNISFTPGYSGFNYTERYMLWIDMDQNGTFEVSDQLISNISGSNTVSGMLFIPSSSIEGITKMRIAMTGQVAPSLCADQGGNIYGEYEDYCVYIGDNASIGKFGISQPKLFPNPTSDIVTIDTKENIESIAIYDMNGKIVSSAQNPSSNEISMINFDSGIYIVSLTINGVVSQQKLIKK